MFLQVAYEVPILLAYPDGFLDSLALFVIMELLLLIESIALSIRLFASDILPSGVAKIKCNFTTAIRKIELAECSASAVQLLDVVFPSRGTGLVTCRTGWSTLDVLEHIGRRNLPL